MEKVQGVQMVGLFTDHFDDAVRFYRDGLGVPLEVDSHGDYHHADCSFHDPYFHFAIFPNEGAPGTKPTHVAFAVTDCEAALRQTCDFGGRILIEPRTVPYSGGGISCEILDPYGNHVELFQQAPSQEKQ